jgi:hypothetical protein
MHIYNYYPAVNFAIPRDLSLPVFAPSTACTNEFAGYLQKVNAWFKTTMRASIPSIANSNGKLDITAAFVNRKVAAVTIKNSTTLNSLLEAMILTAELLRLDLLSLHGYNVQLVTMYQPSLKLLSLAEMAGIAGVYYLYHQKHQVQTIYGHTIVDHIIAT